MDEPTSQVPGTVCNNTISTYDWNQEVGLVEYLYPMATRHQTHERGLEMPKVHGHDKKIDPHKKPPLPPAKPQPTT